ncbi:MAG TPA: hypothetical protein VL967_06595 [Terracidiphilus sp.]|nr:hypothetical protein [Terracidiphilus sp.]
MQPPKFAVLLVAASLALPAFAAANDQGSGQTLITVLPKNGDSPLHLQTQNVQLKVDGKDSTITNFAPAKGPGSPLELVLLIDSSARSSLGTQLNDIEGFVKEMPQNTRMAIAYMDNGRAVFSGPLSSNPAQVLSGLHLPMGVPGQSSSPYFCLSDLAKNWPSHDMSARREVVMITDGVDYYQLHYDPEDPYVLSAIQDSVKAGIVVYSIYWVNQGRIDRTWYENNAGQNLLQEVTQATGGYGYWEGLGNPVSFAPYFKDLRQRFQNQYRVSFSSELKNKAQVQHMSVKLSGAEAKVTAPQQVFVSRTGTNTGE